MGKKDKKKYKAEPLPEQATPALSKQGLRLIVGGILTTAVGFGVLGFTDPRGQNFASDLSPFLIIAGYLIIGFGLINSDPIA